MVRVVTRKILGTICLFVLCGVVVAGLWPFHAPRNQVAWLNGPNGLLFGKYGSIASASGLKVDSLNADVSCSLEMWLEPSRADGTGTILGFYRPEERVVPFAIRQYRSGLEFERRPTQKGLSDAKSAAEVYVDKVFSHRGAVLVTITSGRSGTTVYADGAMLGKFAHFGLTRQDLTGRLVVGNSPVVAFDWIGQFRGLAIYDTELTAGEVSQHLTNWRKNERPTIAGTDGPAGLYLFNEGQGNVVHNQLDSTTNLLIPERFFVLQQQFLERPWDEYRPGWHYWKDIAINIVGFIPLGFFFCGYFSFAGKSRGAIARTIVLGFVVSLTIEILQAFLPTRDSGMTDLITNTLGTTLGVVMFRYYLFPRFRLQPGTRPKTGFRQLTTVKASR
jgi:VanZ family protein